MGRPKISGFLWITTNTKMKKVTEKKGISLLWGGGARVLK